MSPCPIHSVMLPTQILSHLFRLWLVLSELCTLLGDNSLLLSLTGSLGLCTFGVHLLLQNSLTGLLGLGSVDMLNQCSLVFEGVTLGQMVEFVIEVLVNLSRGTILDEKATKDTEATHPDDLARHTGIRCTLPLTETTMSTNPACGRELPGARSRVHGDGLLNDEAILDELSDGLAGVGVRDLGGLIGIKPDLALSTADDRGRQALLGSKIDHLDGCR